MDSIIRTYPNKIKLLDYPERYSREIFKKRDIILDKHRVRYDIFKQNINPDTNRKIKKNGRVYKKLKEEFIVQARQSNRHPWPIHLVDIEYINYNDYNIETAKLNKDIDDKNIKIINENDIIKSVIEKIDNLEDWNDYIEYNGKKYGISKYFKGIHRENNCMGVINLKNKYTKLYSNDRPFMSVERETTYYSYECNKCKCNYEVVGETTEDITGPNYYKSYDKPKYC